MKDMNKDKNIDMAENIARLAAAQGGTVYYVGGYVRDKIRQADNKDIDIEVHGIYPGQLELILDSLGERISIGKSFGVYNLKGYSLDIALPRREEQRGCGHKDFDIHVDPFIGTYKAAMRRDFTVNALLEDVLTGDVIDHFGGAHDLADGVIRHISASTFVEDPLRVVRAAQFAARFGFRIAEETVDLCRRMELSVLPKERIMGELTKALLKSNHPSVFFANLRRMDQLSVWFPELEQTIGVEQNPRHHAEGDVWTHTLMVADAAVNYRDQVQDPLGFMLSAVTHDLGKALCTELTDGELHAYGHETVGLPLAESFLRRLTTDKELIKYVLDLCELHMRPLMLAAGKASVKATNKLFDRAVDPEALVYLAFADGMGKVPPLDDAACHDFLRERLSVFKEYMSRPYIRGRDLIAAGVPPTARFSDYLEYAHKLRLAGVEKESALRQTLARARKNGDYVLNDR